MTMAGDTLGALVAEFDIWAVRFAGSSPPAELGDR
jgi:hypothetical protein